MLAKSLLPLGKAVDVVDPGYILEYVTKVSRLIRLSGAESNRVKLVNGVSMFWEIERLEL